MNLFAGSIVFNGNLMVSKVEFDYVESISKSGDKIIYVFGDGEFPKMESLLDYFTETVGEIKSYDLSLTGKNKVELVGESYEEGLYEVATFQGEQVDFKEIYDRFSEVEEVVSIREAGISETFGNNVVKVDFVY